MSHDLDYRVIYEEGSYDAKDGRVREGSFGNVPDNITGADALYYYMTYMVYGESYHYHFDAPTEQRLNQWWSEGTRKFVMWENVGNGKREKTKFQFEVRPQGQASKLIPWIA